MSGRTNVAPRSDKSPDIPALTGIRAIAAWWVVAYHIRHAFLLGSPQFDYWIQGAFGAGYLGVDLFFCLSGFVIAYNYWDDFRDFQIPRYRHFLWMRLSRLYPVHLATLLLSLTLYTGAKWKGITLHFGSSWTAYQFVQNLLLVHNWSFHPVLSWNYPAWSISCEWLAYLAFPLLVRALLHRKSPLVLGAAMFGSLALLCGWFQFHNSGPVGAGIPRIAVNFFAGVVIFRIQRDCGRVNWGGWLVTASLVLAAAVLALSLSHSNLTPFWMAPVFPVLLYGLSCGSGTITRSLATAPLVFWGRVSYSLYMTHGLVIMALAKLLPLPDTYHGVRPMAVGIAVYLVTIGSLAVATYFLIEEPGRRWMKELPKRWSAGRQVLQRPAQAVRQCPVRKLEHAAN